MSELPHFVRKKILPLLGGFFDGIVKSEFLFRNQPFIHRNGRQEEAQ